VLKAVIVACPGRLCHTADMSLTGRSTTGSTPPAAKLWADGHMPVSALGGAKYTDVPRLRDRAVLDAGITGPQLLAEREGFARADAASRVCGQRRGRDSNPR
jgi:hypothetical protein